MPLSAVDATPLLAVENLAISIDLGGETVRVVSGVDFSLAAGRTLCLVGESGCGKSISALAVIGLLARNARISAGSIHFEGQNLTSIGEPALRRIRGRKIGMIFQEPMSSLNPTMTIGEQIAEVLRQHMGMDGRQARDRAIELLGMVRIARAAERFGDYPFMFSGGMRQRVMIAVALACSPSLLIADEPTTALDVTVQAEVLDLLRDLRRDTGTAILMITHDLGVVAEIADEVAVMYAGRIVERGRVERIFARPEHPYTIGLLGALPSTSKQRLTPILGRVPAPSDVMAGCRFEPRCPFSVPACVADEPPLAAVIDGHLAACCRAPLEAQA